MFAYSSTATARALPETGIDFLYLRCKPRGIKQEFSWRGRRDVEILALYNNKAKVKLASVEIGL